MSWVPTHRLCYGRRKLKLRNGSNSHRHRVDLLPVFPVAGGTEDSGDPNSHCVVFDVHIDDVDGRDRHIHAADNIDRSAAPSCLTIQIEVAVRVKGRTAATVESAVLARGPTVERGLTAPGIQLPDIPDVAIAGTIRGNKLAIFRAIHILHDEAIRLVNHVSRTGISGAVRILH